MEVSQSKAVPNSEGSATEGDELVRSIVALSGLPDESVRSELQEILEMGSDASSAQEKPNLSSMSLDELRAAMLVYLESIHADMTSENGDEANESTDF
jgi:hypothetical protein